MGEETHMTNKEKIIIIKNRILGLKNRDKDNYKIVAKLERKVRNLKEGI